MASVQKKRKKGYSVIKKMPSRATIYNAATKRLVSRTLPVVVSPSETEEMAPVSEECQQTCGPENADIDAPRLDAYSKKQKQRLEQWEDINCQLLHVHTECYAPPRGAYMKCNMCFGEKPESHVIFCKDCGPAALFCVQHYAQHHQYSPFHCPQIWNGTAFIPFRDDLPSLKRMDHEDCVCVRRTKVVTVIGLQGRRKQVQVQFCTCEAEPVTLMRHSLWAASPVSPTIAFHTDLMEWLRALVLDCQISVKGFVDAVATKLDKLEQLAPEEVLKLYKALVTDAHSQYMHHHYQMQQLQASILT